jgi:hypothetical protein
VGGLTLDAAILRLADYVIREVWRIESGWWDRNITSAHPAPLTDSTQAILDAITDKKAISTLLEHTWTRVKSSSTFTSLTYLPWQGPTRPK